MPANTPIRLTFSLFLFLLTLSISTKPATGQSLTGTTPTLARIVQPVDDAARVTVPFSKHRLAIPANDLGRLNGGTALQRMVLVLNSSADQEHQARTLLDSLATKGSPHYHQWLTPEEFGQKFGPAQSDIQQVTGWLQQHGLTVAKVAKSGRWIEFSGTSEQVEGAFQTEMHQYLAQGEMHVANATNISIPAALAPVVGGVLSLHNFYSKPMHVQYRPDANIPLNGNQVHAIAPADLAKIYDLNPLFSATPALNGSGQTIAVVEASNINLSDVATFQQVFGLKANPPTIELNGPDPGVDTIFGNGAEATLDTEWAGAVAPGATIDVVVSGGTLTTDPVALGAAFVVDEDLAPIVSLSFSDCEPDPHPNPQMAFWTSTWEQAAAQGISAFVSSGDSGAAACDASGESLTAAQGPLSVNGFASTQFNTAVGGTEFDETLNGGVDGTFWSETANLLTSVNGYIPEVVWNDSCLPTQAVCSQLPSQDGQFLLLGSGGGLSILHSTPSFQTISGIPGLSSTVLKGDRGVPDVSLDASSEHDPYIFCFTTNPSTPDCQLSAGAITANTFQSLAGGTSFASPEFAGIMAIVDEKLAVTETATAGRQGLANFVLYPLAAAANPSLANCGSVNRGNPATATTCVFNDITVGNNGVPGTDVSNDPNTGSLGFPAATGYDLATGLGTVNALNLVNAWAAVNFQGSTVTLTTNPTTINITHGQPVSVSVTVAKMNSSATATPSGNISLIAQGGNLAGPVGVTSEPISGSGGTATAGPVNVNNLPGGAAYNLSASFPGDGTFAGSDSNTVTVTVGPENSTTTLQSFILNEQTGTFGGGVTVAYADPVHFLVVDADTAGVSGLIPSTGTVTFTINSTAASPVSIDNSGIAEFVDCAPTCLTPGQYMVSASYSGDNLSYNGSTAATALSLTVTKGAPIVHLAAPTGAAAGQPITLTATVASQLQGSGVIAPTGTVVFMTAGTALGAPVTLAEGQATMQVTLEQGGVNNITAVYSGDGNYNTTPSNAAAVNVSTPFSLSTSSTSAVINAGDTATYNLTITGQGGFAGAINFTCTGGPSGSTCTVTPNPVNLSATTTSAAVTVTVTNTASVSSTTNRTARRSWKSLPFVFAGIIVVGFAGLRRRRHQLLLLMIATVLVVGLASCGGGNTTPVSGTPINSTLTVTAASGSATTSITLSLTIDTTVTNN